MMRLQTYAGVSFVAAIAVIYHAFSSREQFYPATVYLSTSKICLVLLLNMGLVIMCITWQLVKRIFLGSLREAEVERLNEQSWREVMEILFAITIFRQDFSVGFLGMVTTLLLIKALHWLAQKRVEYIETTPAVTMLSHIRIVSFMVFLLALDCIFFYNSAKSLIETREASVALFFSFEYMILATTTVSAFIKYIFYVSDMLMEGQWERKAVYTFYLELIRDLLHLSMYLVFFLVIFMNYGVPLHLIRELYDTFRNFKIRIADYIRYRRITSNMNDRFPDATPEELRSNDATCIICREEMVTAKKLRCGHLFHVQCLRSWLERQHTCPTCRASVIPPDGGSSGPSHQHGASAERTQPGNQGTETFQGVVDGATTTVLSPHQLRLQAVAAAASIYKKSFVCPPGNSFIWSPGYAVLPQATSTLHGEVSGTHGSKSFPGIARAALPQQQQSSSSLPCPTFHLQPDVQIPPLESQEVFIRKQIEAFQIQLQLLQEQMTGLLKSGSYNYGNPETDKGKSVVDASAPAPSPSHESEPRRG